MPSAGGSGSSHLPSTDAEIIVNTLLGLDVSPLPSAVDSDHQVVPAARPNSARASPIEVDITLPSSDFDFRFGNPAVLADIPLADAASTSQRTSEIPRLPHYRFTTLDSRQPTPPQFYTSSVLRKRLLMYNPFAGGYNAGETSNPPFSTRRKRQKPGPLLVDNHSLRSIKADDSTDDSTSDERMEAAEDSPTWRPRPAHLRREGTSTGMRANIHGPSEPLLRPPTTVLARYRRPDTSAREEAPTPVPSAEPQPGFTDGRGPASQSVVAVQHHLASPEVRPQETAMVYNTEAENATASGSMNFPSSIPLPPSIVPTPQPMPHILEPTSGQNTIQDLPDFTPSNNPHNEPENMTQLDYSSVQVSSIPVTISPHIPDLMGLPPSQENMTEMPVAYVAFTATQAGLSIDSNTVNVENVQTATQADVDMQDTGSAAHDTYARPSSSLKGKGRAEPTQGDQVSDLDRQAVDKLDQTLRSSISTVRDELRDEMQASISDLRREVLSGVAHIQGILTSMKVTEGSLETPRTDAAQGASPRSALMQPTEAGQRQRSSSSQPSGQSQPQASSSSYREPGVTPQSVDVNMQNNLRRSASPLLRGRSISPSPSLRARTIAHRSSPAVSYSALRYSSPSSSSHPLRQSEDNLQTPRAEAGPSINITPATAGFVPEDTAWPSAQDRLYVPISNLRYQQPADGQASSDRVPMPGGMSPPSPAPSQAFSRRSTSEPPSSSFPATQPVDVHMREPDVPTEETHSPNDSRSSTPSVPRSSARPPDPDLFDSQRPSGRYTRPRNPPNAASQNQSTFGRDMRRRRHSNPAPENFLTNHRPQWDVTLAEDIREHFRLLMNRESNTSGFDLDLVPEAWEIRAFDPALGRACTAACFRPDLNGTPKSPWNKSCYPVFLRSFLAMERKYTMDHAASIEKAFFSHLRYLQTQWADSDKTLTSLQQRQVYRNRRSRKRALLDRRIRAALSHPDTQEDARMLHHMGTDCTSSDESDGENGAPIFKIKTIPWRNPEVTIWLRGFDALYRAQRYGPIMHNSKGAPPRERVESGLVSRERRIPRGLPTNAYNNSVLDALPPWHREDLAEGPAYNFTHSATIRQIGLSWTGYHSTFHRR